MLAVREVPVRSVRRVGLAAAMLVVMLLGSALPAFAAGHGGGTKGGGGGGGRPKGGSSLAVTNPGEQMATQGVGTSLQIAATGPSGDSLSYAASNLPPGLVMDAATGVVSGTPTTAVQYWVTVTVTDTVTMSTASAQFWWFVNAGYDISYPQCPSSFPPAGALGIVGVTDGIVYSANPCLSTQLSWAKNAPALYVNTGDPGPQYSSKWPVSATNPTATEGGQTCNDSDANSTACSYVYGWRAATDALNTATAAAPAGLDVTKLPWWLDVETGNSWQTLETYYGNTPASQDNDIAALRGMSDALKAVGVASVGIYASEYSWNSITGGPGNASTTDPNAGFPLSSTPTWVPASTAYPAGFTAGCTNATNFLTGQAGGISLFQYTVPISGSTFDADYPCP